MPPSLPDRVRRAAAEIAASAQHVRVLDGVDSAVDGVVGFDAARHPLDGDPEQVARYVMVIDTINFGSGWFPTLRHGETEAMTDAVASLARSSGIWWSELPSLTPQDVATVLDEDPAHELMQLYARALRELGRWAAGRDALALIALAEGSASAFAELLATELSFFADEPFYKRAQITANDLVLAGAAEFDDIDDLTVFADNFLPHVLRLDGVLQYTPQLAATIDAGHLLQHDSPEERELRACTITACEHLAHRASIPPRILDNWLWNRALESGYDAGHGAHLCRTIYY